MPFKYGVQNPDEVVFESDSKLECEMVAIALAFTSLYIGEMTYQIIKEKKIIDEVDPQSAPQRMREKLQNAKFNGRIPDQIEPSEFDTYAAYQLRKGNDDLDDIKIRLKMIAINRERLKTI